MFLRVHLGHWEPPDELGLGGGGGGTLVSLGWSTGRPLVLQTAWRRCPRVPSSPPPLYSTAVHRGKETFAPPTSLYFGGGVAVVAVGGGAAWRRSGSGPAPPATALSSWRSSGYGAPPKIIQRPPPKKTKHGDPCLPPLSSSSSSMGPPPQINGPPPPFRSWQSSRGCRSRSRLGRKVSDPPPPK